MSDVSSGKVLLEIKDLTMQFGGLVAINRLNLSIHEDEIFGLIGPNGAGKTTTFNVITQHNQSTAGEIIFDGGKISGIKPHIVVKKGIARTFQNVRLFNELTVRDNVLVGFHMRCKVSFLVDMLHVGPSVREERRACKETDKLLEKVGLLEYADEAAGSLPYGMQRRLEIARALATHPKLLLLDEPAAGMNPQEVVELVSFIKKIRDEFRLTILVIEHHMSLVMNLCEHIAVLEYGVKIAEGTSEEVKNNPRVIESYLGVPGDA